MAQQKVFCTVCNKPLTRQGVTCGARCTQLAKIGYTYQKRQTLKQALSYTTAPVGYITIAQLHLACTNTGLCAVSRMVKHTGSDGVTLPPTNPLTTPVFINNTRYLPGILASKQGLQAMHTGNFIALKVQAWQQAYYQYVLAVQQAVLKGKTGKQLPVKPTLAPTPTPTPTPTPANNTAS